MVSKRFERMLYPALENEGVRLGKTAGYSNIPYDAGGKTIFGISRNKWKKDYDTVEGLWRKDLKKEAITLVYEFYDTHFWNYLYDDIEDESLCFRLFDFGINAGTHTSVLLLQQSLNKYFRSELAEDGMFGRLTLTQINLTKNFDIHTSWINIPLIEKESKLYSAFTYVISLWYKERKTFWKFGRGWFNRLRKIYNENRGTNGKVKWKIIITKAF